MQKVLQKNDFHQFRSSCFPLNTGAISSIKLSVEICISGEYELIEKPITLILASESRKFEKSKRANSFDQNFFRLSK